jgi:haloalkane dehalogenase
MLHGNPTWSFYYRDLIRALRDSHRVVVPDHIGCGLSEKPRLYEYTLATHIDNLERLIDRLELRDVTLVVHDWGGAIGFGWAMRHPELVRRFVIFNTAAFFGLCPFRIRVCRWPGIGALLVRGLNLFARQATWMACRNHGRMTPLVKHGYLLPYDDISSRRAVHRFVQDIPLTERVPSHAVMKQIEAALPQFRDHPMLICWGAQDFCFNDRYLDQWKERFPNADVHCFDQAGHYVVEDAHEQILPLLHAFLAKSLS